MAHYERLFANITSRDDLERFLQLGNFPDLSSYSADDLYEALVRRRDPMPRMEPSALLEAEWKALRAPRRAAGRTDFETEETTVPNGLESFIEQVVLVHRLREVRALQGFTRVEPPGAWDDAPDDPSRIAPLSRGRSDWLPAVLVRGEGVFIELRHEAVDDWLSRDSVKNLVNRMTAAQRDWRTARELPPGADVDPRYVLAHALAHLLIRRMSLDAGYGASSLRERIYGSGTQPMCGLLIYTASTDSDGSLGGLVDLGRPNRLRPLIARALEDARLCSSDPLCSDNQPRVKGMINGAACHACLLASETSCERGNRLLDRAVLIPTLARHDTEYFASA